MSGPNSPASGADKTFRFISDPGHKENLSGRVRAACLTCRRKKIKCSGELNCRTCRERGLMCEGLPERKRPRRDSLRATMLSPAPTNIIKRKAESTDLGALKKSKVKQETESPKPEDAIGAEHSNYASTPPEAIQSVRSPSLIPPALPSVNVKITYKQVQPSSRPFHIESWQLGGERSRSVPTECPVAPQAGAQKYMTVQGQTVDGKLVEGANTSAQWPDTQGRRLPWLEASPHPTLQPEHAIEQPEVQSYDPTSRRQSIAFPLPSRENTFEQQTDPFAGGGGAYDDIATLLYARMGMETGEIGHHGPWDVSTNLGGLLATQVPQPQTHGQGQIHPETHPRSLNDVFGHWQNWPGE